MIKFLFNEFQFRAVFLNDLSLYSLGCAVIVNVDNVIHLLLLLKNVFFFSIILSRSDLQYSRSTCFNRWWMAFVPESPIVQQNEISVLEWIVSHATYTLLLLILLILLILLAIEVVVVIMSVDNHVDSKKFIYNTEVTGTRYLAAQSSVNSLQMGSLDCWDVHQQYRENVGILFFEFLHCSVDGVGRFVRYTPLVDDTFAFTALGLSMNQGQHHLPLEFH